ncbi:hypothetical protein [Lentibacillus salicampi]|uniref:Uncharacterized protein n=1 Tax=Lentibacillus salicampi TaxID=175306 RepID=A0A4Y9ACN9_9BACI|nr:hypothetical protein [Lentibacillus salicampi]TFJ92164.1 hypothetical protein E4U82_13880 [Lentibacillus salicampi]
MSDDAHELDLYFKEKHIIRMNKELAAYKKKMNIKYDPYIYELKNGQKSLYVYAFNEKQAVFIASQNLFYAEKVRTCDKSELMTFNGRDMTFKSIIQNKKTPQILGGFNHD